MICAITGSNGVLGTNFIKQFPNITFIKYKYDLTEKFKLKKWIKNNNFDYFLHFAAIVPINEVNADYQHAKKINYDTVKIIIRELKKKKKKFGFFFHLHLMYIDFLKKN